MVGEQLMAVEAKALGVIGRVVRHRESRSQESREFLHKITAYTTLAVGVLVHCTNAAYSADEDGLLADYTRFGFNIGVQAFIGRD